MAPSDGDGEGIQPQTMKEMEVTETEIIRMILAALPQQLLWFQVLSPLLLDANENLTYHDIQHILVQSSGKNDASDSSWSANGAGHEESKYGFGVVDASAAVDLAVNWNHVDEEISFLSGNLDMNDIEIPDNSNTMR